MVTIQVCMGSSCFIRGSSDVVSALKRLIEEHDLLSRVVLKGSFCMEHCTTGVTVKIGDRLFTGVHAQDVPGLFEREVLNKLSPRTSR